MNFLRGIVVTVIALFVFKLISSAIRNLTTRSTDNKKQDHNTNQDMVQCHKCGVYIVKTNAYTSNNKKYCNKEHAK